MHNWGFIFSLLHLWLRTLLSGFGPLVWSISPEACGREEPVGLLGLHCWHQGQLPLPALAASPSSDCNCCLFLIAGQRF